MLNLEMSRIMVVKTKSPLSSLLFGWLLRSPARELCILTTLARSDPAALEEALERVKVLREMELSDSDDPRKTHYPSAKEAIKHLLLLYDSEAVFESALGLYDLNLAAMVALNSQKDPKEFLPYLPERLHDSRRASAPSETPPGKNLTTAAPPMIIVFSNSTWTFEL
nr:elongator complex protein 1 isoform X1 [Ipomoea batatas]